MGSNGGRIIWKYTFCGFLIMRNPFLRLLFGFIHIGKIQDGIHPKYKCGIIWDLIVVESQENSCIVGFWVWGIHFWSYLFFRFGHIEKIQDGRHPKNNCGIIWDRTAVESWPPTEIQIWDNLRSNGGRITWK